MHQNVSAWFKSVKYNDVKTIEKYISSGFDIETRDIDKRSALHLAAENNAIAVAELLLERGANIEARMVDGGTPLIDAVALNRFDMIKLLLNHGANHNTQDENEWNIIHWAVHGNHIDLIGFFHKLNATLIITQRWNGFSPLHMAESTLAVKTLIALGAPIDAEVCEEGNTPLMEAVIQEKTEVVICLIKHGANILHKDCNGDSALDMAVRYAPQLLSMFNKIVNPSLNKAGHRLRALKTKYSDNKTASLEAIITSTRSVIDSTLIELHASRRVDLFFFILIAYYKTNLRVEIEDTHIQHGMGKKNNNTVGCHSAILPSVFDTRHQESPAHIHSTRQNPWATSYRTSILNNTDFEHSLNATVQLHESVNYFDSHFIEGKSSAIEGGEKMRIIALAILNQVSRGEIDPIIGMKYFFQSMYTHLLKIKNCYLERETLLTSPRDTRLQIYKAQFRGTFFNACGFDEDTRRNPLFELRTDYIRANLPFSAQEREELKERPDMHLPRNQSLAKQAYLQVKEDMELPLQYQHI